MKTNYLISYIYISFFNNQKLISYILNINLSSTNTVINVNNIKGNPKLFLFCRNVQFTEKPKNTPTEGNDFNFTSSTVEIKNF